MGSPRDSNSSVTVYYHPKHYESPGTEPEETI